MANLGSLLYYIRAKNQHFKQGMRENKKEVKELDREVKKNQRTFKDYSATFRKAGIALTAFGAIVVGVGYKLAKMASDANEIQTRFNHVFGEMSDDANDWADNFSESFNQSRSEIKSMMATLQDTLVPMGVMEEQAYDLNKQLTQLALDMSSFANVPLEQAMNDIMSAIVGMSRPMRKYGSVLTETRVKQNALEEGIIETDRELTEQEKILSRVDLMMKDMTKASGDYERTQDSFANQLRETRNQLKNIGEELGGYVLPEFNKLLGYVKDLLEWFNDLPEQTKKVVTQFVLWSGVIAGIVGPLALIVSYLPQIATGFKMIYGAMNPYFLAGGAIIVGLTAIFGLIKDIREETELLTTATKELTEAELKEKKALLETRITRLEGLVERGGEEGSILGARLQTDVQKRRLENYRKKLDKTNKAIDALTGKDSGSTSGGGGGTSTGGMPGWLGPGPEGTEPEIDEEESARVAAEIMDSATRRAIAEESDPLMRELLQLRLQKRQTMRGVENETLRLSLEEEFQAKKQKILDKYVERELMEEEQKAQEIAAINEELTRKINQHTMDEYKFQKWALEQQKIAYKEAGADKVKIEEWYDEELKKIEERKLNREKEAEVRKNRFLLEQREISYYDYLILLEEQLEAEEECTNRWYQLMTEKQNTLNTIVNNEMEYYREQSEEMFGNENKRIEWVIGKLNILKERYSDNKVAVHLINEEIEKLRENITEPNETAESLNWLTDVLVDAGYKIETANEKFGEWKQSMVDGFTEAIVKGEGFLDTLNNIAEQITQMIVQRGIAKPFVDWMFAGLGLSAAHSGAVVTPSGLVQNLPAYHSGGKIPGLAGNERIIKVIPGERILSPRQNKAFESGLMKPEVNVEVINNTGTPVETRREVKFDGTRTVVRLFMDGFARNVEGIRDVLDQRR